jgi:hypothetical protein
MGYRSCLITLSIIQNTNLIMTSVDFNNCSLSERVRFVLRSGTYLNEVADENFKIHLYSSSDFFVEVKIILASSDIESVRAISDEDASALLDIVYVKRVHCWVFLTICNRNIKECVLKFVERQDQFHFI